MEITIRTNHRVVAEQAEQRLFNIMRYGEHLYGNPPHEDRELFNVPWKFARDALRHVAVEFNLQERMVRALARREKPREEPATVADNIIRLRA